MDRVAVRADGHVVPGDGAVGGDADAFPEEGDRAVGAAEQAAVVVVTEAAVEYRRRPVGGRRGDADEAGSRAGVGGRVEQRPRLTDGDHVTGAVPRDGVDGHVGDHRERPRGAPEVLVGSPEADVEVRVDPRSEEPGEDEVAEVVADGHLVARPDDRVDVHDAGDEVVLVGGEAGRRVHVDRDEHEVVVLVGVGAWRTAHGHGIEHLASDGTRRAVVPGVAVDRVPPVVGRVRRVVEREPVVLRQDRRAERDHHRASLRTGRV